MITWLIIQIVYFAVVAILSPLLLFPDVTIPAGVASAVASAGSYAAIFDLVLPVSTLFTVIGLYVAIEVAIFAYKFVMWVVRKIPGIG